MQTGEFGSCNDCSSTMQRIDSFKAHFELWFNARSMSSQKLLLHWKESTGRQKVRRKDTSPANGLA